jgi:hypothetical protein
MSMERRVIVLGMHRSGTSALTRILNLLGLSLCSDTDLMTGFYDNPAGHWESASLCDFNDRILAACGGEWDLPPRLPPEWHRSPNVRALRSTAETLFNAVHPAEEWVWKDPRTCLTLPFWRPIAKPTAALIVTRHPGAIAASLKKRSNIPTSVGLALWERYTRSALQVAHGLPVIVVRYEDMTSDPANGVSSLISAFARIGIDLDRATTDAAGSIRPDLQHHKRQSISLTRRQKNLLAVTERLSALSSSFESPTSLPKERRWESQAFAMTRLVGKFER